jgi:hypothetical protein
MLGTESEGEELRTFLQGKVLPMKSEQSPKWSGTHQRLERSVYEARAADIVERFGKFIDMNDVPIFDCIGPT